MSTPRSDEQPQDTQDTTTNNAITMYTTSWCSDCRRSKRVFAAMGVPFTEIDIEQDDAAAERVVSINNGARSVPTIVFPDGSVLVEPSNSMLEDKLTALATR